MESDEALGGSDGLSSPAETHAVNIEQALLQVNHTPI